MSVLQRKAQAGKQEYHARSMTVPKALRIGLAKAADEDLSLALAVIGATQSKCQGDALSEVLNADDLFLMLDGARGALGGAALAEGFVAALVQQQTIGRVSPVSEGGRRLTTTDAALCAPLVESLFERAYQLLETDKDRAVIGQFKFGARCEDLRLFQLALEEPEYIVIKLTVDVAAGTLQSAMTLVLPVRTAGRLTAEADLEGPQNEASDDSTLEKVIFDLKGDPDQFTEFSHSLYLPLIDIH